MPPRDSCLSRAEQCEAKAAEADDEDDAAEWMNLADAWRRIAGQADLAAPTLH